MKRIVLSLVLSTAASAASALDPAPALPEWMAGMWQMEEGPSWTEEMWTQPRGGMMLGIGRSGQGPRMQSWESMRIEARPDGTIRFIVQPKGTPATEFPLSTISAEAIEFTNAAHDYPQVIRYWRQGQLLMAEVAKMDGSNSQRWNFRPVALAQ